MSCVRFLLNLLFLGIQVNSQKVGLTIFHFSFIWVCCSICGGPAGGTDTLQQLGFHSRGAGAGRFSLCGICNASSLFMAFVAAMRTGKPQVSLPFLFSVVPFFSTEVGKPCSLSLLLVGAVRVCWVWSWWRAAWCCKQPFSSQR